MFLMKYRHDPNQKRSAFVMVKVKNILKFPPMEVIIIKPCKIASYWLGSWRHGPRVSIHLRPWVHLRGHVLSGTAPYNAHQSIPNRVTMTFTRKLALILFK